MERLCLGACGFAQRAPPRSSPIALNASARSARSSGRTRALSPPASVSAGLIVSRRIDFLELLIMSKPVTLKFVFANKDGVTVEHSTDLETLVSDVKNSLISSWPEGAFGYPAVRRAPRCGSRSAQAGRISRTARRHGAGGTPAKQHSADMHGAWHLGRQQDSRRCGSPHARSARPSNSP